MLSAALLHGAAHQQTRSRSWTQCDITWETSRHFHGKQNCCWKCVFYIALLFFEVCRHLLIQLTDESGFIIIADVRDRGRRQLWGQGCLWGQVLMLFIHCYRTRGCGGAGFVFGVIQRNFGFLLCLRWSGWGPFFGGMMTWCRAIGQGWRATPLSFVWGMTGFHVALTTALCFTANKKKHKTPWRTINNWWIHLRKIGAHTSLHWACCCWQSCFPWTAQNCGCSWCLVWRTRSEYTGPGGRPSDTHQTRRSWNKEQIRETLESGNFQLHVYSRLHLQLCRTSKELTRWRWVWPPRRFPPSWAQEPLERIEATCGAAASHSGWKRKRCPVPSPGWGPGWPRMRWSLAWSWEHRWDIARHPQVEISRTNTNNQTALTRWWSQRSCCVPDWRGDTATPQIQIPDTCIHLCSWT